MTASDLTLFKWHFENNNAGNQKSINLNKDCFIDRLYPALPEIAEENAGRIPVELLIYGPGLAQEYRLTRKILKTSSYKNWRLDGEFIADIEETPDRFRVLGPDDLVLFAFSGSGIPSRVRAFFIANRVREDWSIHDALSNLVMTKSMVDIQQQDLKRAIDKCDLDPEHPLNQLLFIDDVEDAALGGAIGEKRLSKRRWGRQVTQDELKKARDGAEEVGRIGEELVNDYLSSLKTEGQVVDFVWDSSLNAISPFDFSIQTISEGDFLLDVKSTRGTFDNIIHISFNELQEMKLSSKRYDIYRVFEIDGGYGKLRIAKNLKPFALKVLDILDKLPEGITPNSISVSPLNEHFHFSEECMIGLSRED